MFKSKSAIVSQLGLSYSEIGEYHQVLELKYNIDELDEKVYYVLKDNVLSMINFLYPDSYNELKEQYYNYIDILNSSSNEWDKFPVQDFIDSLMEHNEMYVIVK